MSELTNFYIIRHGETDWNKTAKIQGQTDIQLNKTGKDQATTLAKRLGKISFDLAFSSDLLRASETTQIIAMTKKLSVQTNKLLRERKYGHYEGKPSTALLKNLKKLQKLPHKKRFSFKEGGSESDEEIAKRLKAFLAKTAQTYPGKNVLVGSHGGIIRAFLIDIGFGDYNSLPPGSLENGALVVVSSDGRSFQVKTVERINQNKFYE